jgi:serine/threonine protein kinase
LIHRDIKPSNIIFVNGIPKLADIGLVTDAAEGSSFVGTEGFIPPEGSGTIRADIYSLGKVLYEISTGKDRNEYPALPQRLGNHAEMRDLILLNKIILKACRVRTWQRYQTSEEMMQALLAFQFNKESLRNKELADVLGRAGLILALAIIVCGIWRIIWLIRHGH